MLTALGVLGLIWLLKGGLDGPADMPAWNVPPVVRNVSSTVILQPASAFRNRLSKVGCRLGFAPRCRCGHRRHQPAVIWLTTSPVPSPQRVYPSPQSPW